VINIVLVMLLLLIGLNFMIQRLVEDHVLTRLQHDAESLISLVEPLDDTSWDINTASLSTIYNRVRSGHYYVIKTPHQTLRSRSLFDFEVAFENISDTKPRTFQLQGPEEERWLVWEQLFYKNSTPLQVWVSEDIQPLYSSLYQFSMYAVVIVVFITLLSIYVQQKILNRAFHVFESLRQNLRAIRRRESTIEDTQVPVEVLPLVKEIELLVDQLSLRIQRTRNAIANLSHEIKRPLQLLSLNSQSADDQETSSQAIKDIQNIVDRELRRAKVSGSSMVGGEFRVAEELPFLLTMMQKIYPAKKIHMDVQQGLNDIHLDRDDLLELFGNLLDNACKFASAEILLHISEADNALILCFEDDGAGVDPALIDGIATKGVRLDESVQGHGLGLSICADIIHSYQGKLEFSQSDLGGLKVLVSMPLR
jgi:signal transduction histidine kinase